MVVNARNWWFAVAGGPGQVRFVGPRQLAWLEEADAGKQLIVKSSNPNKHSTVAWERC